MKLKYEKSSSFDDKSNPFKNNNQEEDDFYPTIDQWHSMENKEKLAYTHD